MRWKSEYYPSWQKKFAWMPVILNDKMVVWLETYYARYVSDTEPCEHCLSCDDIGHWDYCKERPV